MNKVTVILLRVFTLIAAYFAFTFTLMVIMNNI